MTEPLKDVKNGIVSVISQNSCTAMTDRTDLTDCIAGPGGGPSCWTSAGPEHSRCAGCEPPGVSEDNGEVFLQSGRRMILEGVQ